LYKNATGKKDISIVKNADHNFLNKPYTEQATDLTCSWFKKTLISNQGDEEMQPKVF